MILYMNIPYTTIPVHFMLSPYQHVLVQGDMYLLHACGNQLSSKWTKLLSCSQRPTCILHFTIYTRQLKLWVDKSGDCFVPSGTSLGDGCLWSTVLTMRNETMNKSYWCLKKNYSGTNTEYIYITHQLHCSDCLYPLCWQTANYVVTAMCIQLCCTCVYVCMHAFMCVLVSE